jgi:nucleotide-binding universal stress UspA family protein
MNEVIAALDNSLAATPVLATAQSLAELLDAQVVPVHVAVNGDRVAQNTAAQAGLMLRTLTGPVIEQLLEQGNATHVSALVIGARGMPGERRALGSTAEAVVTALRKPVVIVPPEARVTARLQRILVPIESRLSPSLTPRAAVELGREAALDVVALHVHEPTSLPAFTDQPQHEHTAWTREFLRRYCPWGIDDVRLEVRIGETAEAVSLVAEELGVDLVALGWASELAEARSPIVHAALARAKVPVMLVPVRVAASVAAA